MPFDRLVSVKWIPSASLKIAVAGAETDWQINYLVDTSKSLFSFLIPDKGRLKVSNLFVSIFLFLWIIQAQ